MRDITKLMDHYRVVARALWNFGFWPEPSLQNWNSRDRFDEIKSLLLEALVLAQISDLPCQHDASAVRPLFHVVPSTDAVPIMIENPRPGDRNRYWDDPVNRVAAAEVELHFVDFFDWNDMSYRDFQYYKVRVASFATHPHLVGREALLEHQYARVVVETSDRAQR